VVCFKATVKHFAKSTGNETLGKIASGLKGKKFKGVSSEPQILQSNDPPVYKQPGGGNSLDPY
jgi:hypothetical protein